MLLPSIMTYSLFAEGIKDIFLCMAFIAFFNASLFSLEAEKMTLPDFEKAFVISDAIAFEV